MRLPREVTGLADAKTGLVRSKVSAKLAKAAAHAAARAAGAKEVGYTAPDVTPSFHLIHVESGGQPIAVLIHRIHWLVAFAGPLDQGSTEIAFRDHPGLAAAFLETTEFRPLSAAELDEPLAAADQADLDEAEQRAIRYWRPHTVGTTIYNWFV